LSEARSCRDGSDSDCYIGAVFVEDLTGLTLAHLLGQNLNMLGKLSTTESLYYPETIRRAYFINTPNTFYTLWKVCKKFLDPGTIGKVEILGSNYQDVLTKIIPPEFLPKAYGGEMEYYPEGGGPLKGYTKDLKPTKVLVYDKFEKTVNLKEDSIIAWEFKTKSYDIGFGLFYEYSPDKREEIIPIARLDSHKEMVVGIYSTTKAGVHVLHWDNTYSMSRSKDLSYQVFVDGQKDKDGLVEVKGE